MIEISVVVPTRNRAPLLKKAVESLARQDYPAEKYEIIVVDNGSTDDTEETVRRAVSSFQGRRIRSFMEEVPGLLSGRHRGAREAEGEILSFVDDDIEAVPGWLGSVAEAFRRQETVLVGGRSLPKYDSPTPVWLDCLWHETPFGGKACGELSLMDMGEGIQRVDPLWVWGLNFSIRRKTLFDMGGFHPDCMPGELQRFQGDGEVGLTLKIREGGHQALYHPGAAVYHNIPAARLTMEYFEQRRFYQGVCDSFTEIRRQGHASSPGGRGRTEGGSGRGAGLLGALRKVRAALRTPPPMPSELKDLRRRMERGYREGHAFHQDAVLRDPRLLAWVLRDDYFDYRLPL